MVNMILMVTIITTLFLLMIIMSGIGIDSWLAGSYLNSYFNINITSSDTIKSSSSVTPNINEQQQIRHSLLDLPGISAEYVWDQLLIEASFSVSSLSSSAANDRNSNQQHHNHILIMEVGMHTARQCIQAAQLGLSVHCIEPSPKSFARVQSSVSTFLSSQQQEQEPKNRKHSIHLYNMAASSESGHEIPFVGSGGTGDHVGEYDMWNMQPGKPNDPALMAKQGDTIHVPTIRLDDIITNATTRTIPTTTTTSPSEVVRTDPSIFLIKVDTQGYEPFVVQGMSNSLAKQQIQFVLMEYWPRGIDLISSNSSSHEAASPHNISNNNACTASTEVLQQFLQYGYTIYALPPSSHPRAPMGAKQFLQTHYVHRYQNQPQQQQQEVMVPIPTTSIRSFCEWFYHVEELFPSSDYKMGYWADILAVATLPTIRHKKDNRSNTPRPIEALHTDLMKRIVQDQQAQRIYR
jgi:Methyltransferase FkbM domain